METLTLHLMDTEIYVGVEFEQPTLWQPAVKQWFHYVALQWSRFNVCNELHRINTLAIDETIQVTKPLYDCLQLAQQYHTYTNGLFSPYLKNQMEAHGYDRTFSDIAFTTKNIPSIEAPALMFIDDHRIKKVSNASVDLGGIAKGFAASYSVQLIQSLGKTAYGIVDVGGDIEVWSHTEKVWQLGISNPDNSNTTLAVIPLKNGAVASSNKVKRSWADGQKNHLLNGQTGNPYLGDILQITAVAKRAYLAEVAAKTSFFTDTPKAYFPQIHRYIVTPNAHFWV